MSKKFDIKELSIYVKEIVEIFSYTGDKISKDERYYEETPVMVNNELSSLLDNNTDLSLKVGELESFSIIYPKKARMAGAREEHTYIYGFKYNDMTTYEDTRESRNAKLKELSGIDYNNPEFSINIENIPEDLLFSDRAKKIVCDPVKKLVK